MQHCRFDGNMDTIMFTETKLPDKLYFRIGEVSALADLPTYVLRFWETEFSQIKPKRTPSGQRIYTKSDVAIILKIKYLLYNQKYTIPGAKQHLKAKTGGKKENSSNQVLAEIRQELESIRELLK
jgi:DNA-binding transcriptional MerR regulator